MLAQEITKFGSAIHDFKDNLNAKDVASKSQQISYELYEAKKKLVSQI